MQNTRSVTITDNATGKQIECDVLEPTHGAPVVDISRIYRDLGMFTHDPGYGMTSSCDSTITYIDGDEGVLLYRGYPIEQLAANSSYLEVCHLLMFGELPTPEEFSMFSARIRQHSMVHEGLREMIKGYRYGSHPMGMLVGLVGGLSTFYHDALDIHNPEHRITSALRIVAKMPTLAADIYKFDLGQPFNNPTNSLGFVNNFMNMMFAVPAEPYDANPTAVRALELMLILHADHEQNASTSTVRLAGSSGANPYSCIAAGIATLWGPAHGGANEAVIKMLNEIGDAKNVARCVERAKDPNDNFRLMGFGHRVYKNYDPRAKIIREACHDLLAELVGTSHLGPLFETAQKLEQIALEDDYFVERNLYPNVDFYSGIILSALNIPMNMFTVMFAMARSVGWIAQWHEMMSDKTQRIGRPRQRYIGAERRDFVLKRDR